MLALRRGICIPFACLGTFPVPLALGLLTAFNLISGRKRLPVGLGPCAFRSTFRAVVLLLIGPFLRGFGTPLLLDRFRGGAFLSVPSIGAALLFALCLFGCLLTGRLAGLSWSFVSTSGNLVFRRATPLARLFRLRLLSCLLRFSSGLRLSLLLSLTLGRPGLILADRRLVLFSLRQNQRHRATIRRTAFRHRRGHPGLRKLRQQKRQAGCNSG